MNNQNQPSSFSSELLELNNLSLAFENIKDMISRHAEDGTFRYLSPSCQSLLGYQPTELINRNILEICHPLDVEKVTQLPELLTIKESKRMTIRLRRESGDYIWVESIATQIRGEKDFLMISRDITKRVITEEEIKETREKYRLLVEYSKDTIGMITPDGIWTYINETGNKLLGTTSNLEVIGTSLYNYLKPEDHSILHNHLHVEENAHFEVEILRKDHYIRKTDCQIIPTFFKNRKMFHIIITDVTQQKETEEQLQNTEKLSVIGQLAAGIAHEIRNPLTAIKGFTQLLHDSTGDANYINIILEELERVEQIVSDLLILSKPQASNKDKADLTTLIKQVVALLNSEAAMSNILIVEDFSLPEIIIECEPNKIKQVLINVIKNAIEAMPEGGEIHVSIQLKEDMVITQIMDQGMGIPKERLAKLGEPFYSTKEKGTGLGLMICQKIIKNHHGHFQIYSEENKGTLVQIALPYSNNSKEQPTGG